MKPEEKEKKFKGNRKPGKEAKRVKDAKFDKFRKGLKDKPYLDGHNDSSWRTSDKIMTKLVANLPFGIPAGLPQPVSTSSISASSVNYTQPGVLAIAVYLTAGNTRNYNSAVNLAARKIYSFVRHANSGSRNYEAVDMAMFFIAVGQVIGLLGFLQRALRVVKEYSATNRYTPVTLLNGMGLDPDDIIANQAQLKYVIGWTGKVLKGLAYPDLPYFRACYEAFQYIYVDNDSPKEQYYMLIPANFGIYDPTYNVNGGGVRLTTSDQLPTPATTTRLTVAQLYSYVKARTDVLLGDEDIGIISGDILKAFSNGGKLYMPECWDLEYPVFQHSQEMLQQIHNATVLKSSNISVGGYKQDPGGTGTAPYVVDDIGGLPTLTSGEGITHNTIIDAFSRDPDPEEVVNCLILNPQVKVKSFGGTPTAYGYDDTTWSFDLFLPVDVYFKTNVTGAVYSTISNNFDRSSDGLTSSVQLPISNFDWHPMRWTATMAGTSIVSISLMADIQNLRIFSYDVGYRIHENSILNLFAFQDINFVSK